MTTAFAKRIGTSFRVLFRLRRECFQEWRAGKGQSAKQIPQGRSRTVGEADSFAWDANSVPYRFPAVYARDTRQLSFEMRDCACIRIVCIEITESPAQQSEQFRFAMITLGANLNQFNEVGGSLRAQIIAANSGERIFQNDFRERVEIGFAAAHDRNFSLKKQIEFPCKRTLLAACSFGDRLNAAKRFRAPRHDQTRVAEFSFPKKDCLCAIHSPQP